MQQQATAACTGQIGRKRNLYRTSDNGEKRKGSVGVCGERYSVWLVDLNREKAAAAAGVKWAGRFRYPSLYLFALLLS